MPGINTKEMAKAFVERMKKEKKMDENDEIEFWYLYQECITTVLKG